MKRRVLLTLSIICLSLSYPVYATQVGSLTPEETEFDPSSVDSNEATQATDKDESNTTASGDSYMVQEFEIEVDNNNIVNVVGIDDNTMLEDQPSTYLASNGVATNLNDVADMIGKKVAYYVHNQSDIDGTIIPELSISISGEVAGDYPTILEYYNDGTYDTLVTDDEQSFTTKLSQQPLASGEKTGILFGLNLTEGHYTIHGRLRVVMVLNSQIDIQDPFQLVEGLRSNILDTESNNTDLELEEQSLCKVTLINNEESSIEEIDIPYGNKFIDYLHDPIIKETEFTIYDGYTLDGIKIDNSAVCRQNGISLVAKYKSKMLLPGPEFNAVLKELVQNDLPDNKQFLFRPTVISYENQLIQYPNVTYYDVSLEQDRSTLIYTMTTTETGVYIISKYHDILLNTDASYMFSEILGMTTYHNAFSDKKIITKHVTNMERMFNNCSSLKQLTFTEFNTSNVEDMNHMFAHCEVLPSLDLTIFDTRKVTSMYGMFTEDQALASVNISSFCSDSLEDTSEMFKSCKLVTSLQLPTTFTCDKVRKASAMFISMASLNQIDLGNTTFDSCQDMSRMFYGCGKLTTLDLSSFTMSSCITMDSMFQDCRELVNINIAGWNTSNVEDMSEVWRNCYALLSLDTKQLSVSSCKYLVGTFGFCFKLEGFNFSSWDTRQCIDMSGLFVNVDKIINLDIRSFDTHNVTKMANMFGGLDFVTQIQIDTNRFYTGNVETMEAMFQYCGRLQSFPIQSFDTRNVKNMSFMFRECLSVQTLDITNFNTSKVETMAYMFNKCISLKNLKANDLNTQSLTNIEGLFGGAIYGGGVVDLSGWNVSNVVNMLQAFSWCRPSVVATVNLTGWVLGNSVNAKWMFADSCNLKVTYSNSAPSRQAVYTGMFESPSDTSLIKNNCTKPNWDAYGTWSSDGSFVFK